MKLRLKYYSRCEESLRIMALLLTPTLRLSCRLSRANGDNCNRSLRTWSKMRSKLWTPRQIKVGCCG